MTTPTAVKPSVDDKKKTPVSVPAGTKEVEPKSDGRAQEAAAIAEIKEVSDSHDKEALRLVRESLPEAKSPLPKIEIPPDVADAGLSSPEADGEEVLKKGPTINVDITEEEYGKGLKMAADGQTDKEKTVFGTGSIVALAIWIKRMIKLAHKHTMRIVFRKSSSAPSTSLRATEGKEEKDAD